MVWGMAFLALCSGSYHETPRLRQKQELPLRRERPSWLAVRLLRLEAALYWSA
jgi:hypothetical protein